jgi:GNAT superfamily N-acetyltransferase
MEQSLSIRHAELADIPMILHHRHGMFEDMGVGTPESRDRMDVDFEPWLRTKMENGDYIGWFVVNEADEIVCGAGLWIMEWAPGPLDLSTRRAYVLNVYTEPAWRRRGIAQYLVQSICDWCKQQGFKQVLLHASDAGRPIYERLGFLPSPEMRLTFPTE